MNLKHNCHEIRIFNVKTGFLKMQGHLDLVYTGKFVCIKIFSGLRGEKRINPFLLVLTNRDCF